MIAGSRPTGSSPSDPGLTASELAVVIPTRERWDKLRRTLLALQQQTAHGFETIVVVDGADQTVPALPGVRVLQQEHAGPGAARNRGAGATDRQLILFIGDDMVPRPDLVARHLAQHRHEPAREVAVLGRVVWHPSIPRDRLHRWLDWSGALFDFPQEPDRDAGWGRFYSCNVSMKREFFTDSGGFDPDFLFDYEDLDLGWRLGQRGLRLVYEPRALVQHLHRYDWPAVQRRYESRAHAERLMMAKHNWFRPWFHDQMTAAQGEPRASRLWPLAVDWIPRRPRAVRSRVEQRADRHYRQGLAPSFLAAWDSSRGGNAGAVK